MNPTENTHCMQIAEKEPSLCLDFTGSDGRTHGFPYAQMLNYLLEQNPDREDNDKAPPDRLSIWFSTHDVLILGHRLNLLRAQLRVGLVVAVSAMEARYSHLEIGKPFVTEIIVTEATQNKS